jgi:hypothetical protein
MSHTDNGGVRLLHKPATTTQAERGYAERLYELIAEMERPRECFSSDYDPLSYNTSAWDRQR